MRKSPKKTMHEKMGKCIFVVFCLIMFVLSGTNIYALDLLGSPAAEIRKDQLNVGFEYSMGSMQMELTGGAYKEKNTSLGLSSGSTLDLTLEDFETDKMSIYFGYGIDRDWELFARLGGASAEFGDSLFNTSESLDSDFTPSLGFGTRLTFIKDRDLKIGAVAQVGWTKYNGLLDSDLWASPGSITADLKEFQASIGAEYKWTKDVLLYGGPFFHYVMGEFDFDYVSFDSQNTAIVTTNFTWDMEASSSIGGYLGTKVDLGGDSFLNLEYQTTGDSSVFGAGMVVKY